MDMSLDELIRNKRTASRSARRGGGRQGDSRDGNNKRGGANFRSNVSASSGIGPMRNRDRSTARRANGFNPYWKDNVKASWNHDTYNGPKKQQMRGGLSNTNIHRIIISNLSIEVTSLDIRKLFGEFGPLKTATVHYNRFGISLGTANVEFNSKYAALKAVSQYNNVPLDGRPMMIELITDLSTVDHLVKLSRPELIPVRGIRGGRDGTRGMRGNTRGACDNNHYTTRGRGGRGGRGTGRKIPKKEELDVQLENIIKNQKTDKL